MLFVQGIGERIPFGDSSFDAVIIYATLDHCTAPRSVIGEVFRVLRPKGVLAIALNNNRSWLKRLLPTKARQLRHAAAAVHNFFFSPEDIVGLLGQDFLVLEHFDITYLPIHHTIKNPLVGRCYGQLARLADWLGARILKHRGGFFITIARKAVL
jgi:ubiquinone/menaquinone biosynthesis C-methylase UbiE